MTPGQHVQALASGAITGAMREPGFRVPVPAREAMAAAVVAAVAGAGVPDGEQAAGVSAG